MINVLQLLSSLEVGGLEKLLVDFLKASEAYSSDVNYTVVVMNNKINETLKNELLSTKYNVYFMNRKEGHKHPKYLFQLLDIIKQNNISIIHTHTYGGKIWSILCKVVKSKLKLIFTVHSSSTIKSFNKIQFLVHKIFIDKNISISNEIYNNCINNKIKTEKIYNGVNIQMYNLEIKSINEEYLNIINIGRIAHKVKGQDILIKALKLCKDKGMNFKCDLVGTIHSCFEHDRATYAYLKELIKELDLENEIQFLGTRNDIPELLSNSDLFILPSRFEGLPVSILEAMASNLPVIASNISGSNDLITNGKNGLLFESENYEELADKILYLYNNKEIREVLAESACKFVQDFDISVMYKKYCELYKELVGR